MKLKVDGDFLYDERGVIVAVLTDNCTPEIKQEIAFGSESIGLIKEMIKNTYAGQIRPKTTVKKFETLMNKHELVC